MPWLAPPTLATPLLLLTAATAVSFSSSVHASSWFRLPLDHSSAGQERPFNKAWTDYTQQTSTVGTYQTCSIYLWHTSSNDTLASWTANLSSPWSTNWKTLPAHLERLSNTGIQPTFGCLCILSPIFHLGFCGAPTFINWQWGPSRLSLCLDWSWTYHLWPRSNAVRCSTKPIGFSYLH